MTIPEDPVQVWINRVHRFALTLMDETPIISVGMKPENSIVTTPLHFEWLDSETVIRKRVAQYRSSRLLIQRMTTLYLLSSLKRLARAIRSASNR